MRINCFLSVKNRVLILDWWKILISVISGCSLYLIKDFFDNRKLIKRREENEVSVTRYTSFYIMDLWISVCAVRMHFKSAFEKQNPLLVFSLINEKKMEFNLHSMSFVLEQEKFIDLFNKLNASLIDYQSLVKLLDVFESEKNAFIQKAQITAVDQTGLGKISIKEEEYNNLFNPLLITLKEVDKQSTKTLESLCYSHKMLSEFLKKRYHTTGIRSVVREDYLQFDLLESIAIKNVKSQ